MPKKFSEEKRMQWKEVILNQRDSGLSINPWCHENNISTHTFRYWQNKLFPKVLDRSAFTEIQDDERSSATDLTDSGISIDCHGWRIYLKRQFDPIILKKCIKTLREISC